MSSSTSTPKGTDTPPWTRRGGDSEGSWRTTREPNAAFRGASRSRGRGGGAVRGRPGGGRGTGGRSVSTRFPMDISKSTPATETPVPKKTGASVTAAAGGGTAVAKNNAAPLRIPKVPSRPNINVDGQVTQSSDPLLSPSKPPRRARRNTHRRAASASVPKPILPDGLPVSPSAPLTSTTKEAKEPPLRTDQTTDNTTHVHDLRQEITSLVDRVRTMAMDGAGPKSPATHIDWAGDDDDSLPDLDDWGISSKLVSDVGAASAKTASKPEPVAQTLPDTTSTSVPERVELRQPTNGQSIPIDGAQSSAESPTESSMSMSLSAPVPAKRTRERRRGGRRDKEKKLLLASQASGSNDKPAPLATTSKKSLLERISSPVRPNPPPLSHKTALALSTPGRVINSSKSEPNMYSHSSLPPKPPSLPNKPVSPNKRTESWRNRQPNRSLVPKEIKTPARVEPLASDRVYEGKSDNVEKVVDKPPPVEEKEEPAPFLVASSFDWSEEPLPSETAEPAEPPKGPSVDVEPPTPSVTTAPAPLHRLPSTSSLSPSIIEPKLDTEAFETKSIASTHSSPRFRSQRPLSGDATPRSARRDRSPYKFHTPRNHSMPHVGGGSSPTGRSRPQHVSRPIIRMDALAMISRSLRESPTPPRRDSPPVTKVGEAS